MKDIFAIQCPMTDKIVALSMRNYGQIPLPVYQNEKYWEWVAELRKERLSPFFKILDKVNDEDADIIFEMYLGLFRSWNIPLFNDQPRIESIGLTNYLGRPEVKKYLLNDIGRMNSCLELFLRYIKTKPLSNEERTICHELILLCWMKCNYNSESILNRSANSFEILFSKISGYPVFIRDCFTSLKSNHIIDEDLDHPFFSQISKLSEGEIINGINFIFLKCQMRLIFSKTIWDNLFEIYSFLKNPKVLIHRYEIGLLFSNLQVDVENQLKLNEYDELSSKLPTGRTIFSHLASTPYFT